MAVFRKARGNDSYHEGFDFPDLKARASITTPSISIPKSDQRFYIYPQGRLYIETSTCENPYTVKEQSKMVNISPIGI